ncbi:uncharacterized protein M421DRAFT_425967 [Didymella exigua CBS 183.55]|uniref:Uncharacterized protein n=1 Tax=Didymella exigua CBS 183.55 TaxID=1150837 RepID=A0A6A5R7X7_9PLEO|nr:uncharacterized protein M421DRAFT_425967 [Didymella exigua CBS 183.55]KAF1923310.1 hypothetical protein M421DRAFT_425967 [Didymella exigua CBS 183.55]
MLAKTIYVVAGNAILDDYTSLVSATRSCAHVNPESHFEQFARLVLVQKDHFNQKHLATGRILISDSWINNWGLVNLLHHFGDKCCTVRRDMVYSVLSLSREAETIKVNYSSSTIEAVRKILEVGRTPCVFAQWLSLCEPWGESPSQMRNPGWEHLLFASTSPFWESILETLALLPGVLFVKVHCSWLTQTSTWHFVFWRPAKIQEIICTRNSVQEATAS